MTPYREKVWFKIAHLPIGQFLVVHSLLSKYGAFGSVDRDPPGFQKF